MRAGRFLSKSESKLKFFIRKYVFALIFMCLCVKNEHLDFVKFYALGNGGAFLSVTVVFLHKINCWPFPGIFFHFLNAHVIRAHVMAEVVGKILMQSSVVCIF